MKLNITTLDTKKLEAMEVRLRERIAIEKTNRDIDNLACIEKELKHRAKIRLAVQEELGELDKADSNYDSRREEILLRGRLQLTDNHTKEYEVLYHKWFAIRESSVAKGLYKFFVPEGGKRERKLRN